MQTHLDFELASLGLCFFSAIQPASLMYLQAVPALEHCNDLLNDDSDVSMQKKLHTFKGIVSLGKYNGEIYFDFFQNDKTWLKIS